MPPDLAGGAYRILDLNHNPTGSLYEGKVIVDKRFGHAAYGCSICCGPNNPFMVYNPLFLPTGRSSGQTIDATNSCTKKLVDVTGDFPTWWTGNTSVATATASAHQINGVAVGTTDHDAQSINMYWGPITDSGGQACPMSQEAPNAGTNVISITQSPVTLNMSSGDTTKGITVIVSPTSVASSTVFAQGSTTNPNSSTTATFTYNKPARSQETTSGRSLSAEPIRPQAFRAHKPAHLASVRLNLLRPMYRRRS